MTTEKFLPYARQSINAEDIECVNQALRQETITRGPFVEEFEQAVAAYCGAKFGVAFSNGTAALKAACFAVDLNAADRCLVSPNTFVATVSAPMQRKSEPIFIDIDRSSGNLNLDQLAHNLERKTTRGKMAIFPVHFAGIAVDMENLDHKIARPDVVVIEDAAHAIGSRYPNGQRVGSCQWSDITIFSFHPVKLMTTGEGGMAMTNDPELYRRLRLFRDSGIERKKPFMRKEEKLGYYEAHALTGNYHLTDFQAALGLSQLRRLDLFIEKRRKLIKLYRQLLEDRPEIRLFDARFDDSTAYHLCVAQIDYSSYKTTREEVMKKLKEENIGSQVHYIPLYKHPFFSDLRGDISRYFPQTEAYYASTLSLPLYYELEEEDVERVVKALKKNLKR